MNEVKDNGSRLEDVLPPLKKEITITAPNMQTVIFHIRGTSPYCQQRFGEKQKNQMKAKQEAGSTAKKGGKKSPKDFKALFEEAKHISTQGWCGIPAPAFRSAMISACRICGFMMTRARLAVFVQADGFDKVDAMPLVQITKGEPTYHEQMLKNDSGVADIRVRPLWHPGWEATVKVIFDADIFTASDVANLMARVGMQVGIGEGRHDSRQCGGIGWGQFEICNG
jgi:hypothetical protein